MEGSTREGGLEKRVARRENQLGQRQRDAKPEDLLREQGVVPPGRL